MKVLVIDDIPDSVKGILDYCEEKGWEKKIVGFEASYKSLFDFNPDVIILDWYEGTESTEGETGTPGSSLFNIIWNNTFRPVIVFSANAALIDISSELEQSKVLKILKKGDEQPVYEYLEQIVKVSDALSAYRSDMGLALIESLNALEKMSCLDDVTRDAVEYVLARRTSAFFEDKYVSEISPSWVQYLCPPLTSSLNVCDILKKRVTEEDSVVPENYLLVLTPSCDLCHDHGVGNVLCACCCEKEKFHGHPLVEPPGTISNTNLKSTKSKLNAGYNVSYVPLPKFADVIPYMTVDLKKLVLLPIESIATCENNNSDKTEYVRVASICSPFREQIVWAHLQNSCRPGVPDRNTELWAQEILVK